MTGAPVKKYFVSESLDTDKLWDDFAYGAENGHLMSCSFGPVEYCDFITSNLKCHKDDLINGIAYTILTVKEFEDDDNIIARIKGENLEGKRKLLKIRN